jgi:PAB-dependent poly(A)-specific ribonuclease subunit 2
MQTVNRTILNCHDLANTLQIPSTEQYTMMKRGGQYVCAATSSGSVQLLNPKTLAVLKTWKAHGGWVNDMDANSSFLVTCGWSPRQQFGQMLDPLAKVFDLKTLMPLPPVSFHAGAAFVRMHPRMLTTAIIASQSGQLQLVDIMNSSMVTVRQISLLDSYLLNMDIAPSGEALALADSSCTVQLWGSPSRMTFTSYSNPTEFPDQVPQNRPSIGWRGNE